MKKESKLGLKIPLFTLFRESNSIILRIRIYGIKIKQALNFYVYFRNKIGDIMSTPAIQEDHAAQLVEEAAAAVRAALEDHNHRPGPANPANSAAGGFVQTDYIFPPATERSKIIKINRHWWRSV